MNRVTSADVPPVVGRIVQVAGTGEFGRARLGFSGSHEHAGTIEVGFLDGSTRLVPFDGVRAAWPFPSAYDDIPQYPHDSTDLDASRSAVCSQCGFIGAWMVDVNNRAWFEAHAEDDGIVPVCDGCWRKRSA